jgi:uncharacterized protein (UPF0335 family)
MTLSLKKLEEILSSRGFIIKKLFVIKGECVYIMLLNINNGDVCMLYIPSKYRILEDDRQNTYDIESIDVDVEGNIADDYSKQPENIELEMEYDEIELERKADMEEYLENKYNNPIELDKISKKNLSVIKDGFRQLKRLRFCVKNLKYKLCIISKNYLCCIKRDNRFDGYLIKNYENNIKEYYISIDLETLYNKIDRLSEDIQTIKQNISEILNKNQSKHNNNLMKMIVKVKDIMNIPEQLYLKKIKYKEYLEKLENLLEKTNESGKNISNKILSLKDKYSDVGIKGLYNDLESSRRLSSYENELRKITETKQEIIKNIIRVKEKYEELLLKVDSVFFDTSVMIDTIIKNLSKLENV